LAGLGGDSREWESGVGVGVKDMSGDFLVSGVEISVRGEEVVWNWSRPLKAGI
jgi:hypothetical protein